MRFQIFFFAAIEKIFHGKAIETFDPEGSEWWHFE